MKSYFFRQINIILIIVSIISLNGCGIYKYTDAREVSPDPGERVKKNIEEGKGLRLATLGEKNGNFQFASSNPLWRASLDVIDFAPLLTANYSGGIIITDWVSTENENENESYKITIKFLSNEIRSDGLDIIIHQKLCKTVLSCKIEKLETSVSNDLKLKILKRATLYKNNDVKKIKEKYGEYRVLP